MPPSNPHEPFSGDADAGRSNVAEFEALFRTHHAGLCDFVYAYVRSHEVARELVQDLFLRLWERADAVPSPITAAYLYTAARNRAIRHIRRERVAARWVERQVHDPAPVASSPSADAAVQERELREAIDRIVAGLPERCRLVFTLSRHQHLSNAEIAATLGISVKTVEQQMWRALKVLRVKLAPFLVLLLVVGR